MDKNTTYLVIGLVLVLVLFSPTKKGQGYNTTRPGSSPYPIAGPSPLGTSWAQNGPVPNTAQSNGYDLGIGAVNAFGRTLVGLANAGVFTPDDNETPASPTPDDSYDPGYVDSLDFG